MLIRGNWHSSLKKLPFVIDDFDQMKGKAAQLAANSTLTYYQLITLIWQNVAYPVRKEEY